MITIRTSLLTILLLTFSGFSVANQELDELRGTTPLNNEWQLHRTDRLHNITTYIKQEDGKRYRSYKVEAELDASIDAVARACLDIANLPKWYWKLREAKLLRKISDTEFIYYLVHEAPPGTPDRDVVLHLQLQPYTRERGYLSWTITALPDYLPPRPPFVRMIAEDQVVTLTPIGDNKTRFRNEGYIDPGGKSPVWAINYIQKSAPYYVMLGLSRILNSENYNDSGKPFLFRIR
jgi:hypothetical protein